jgi:hypothetical protein
VLDLLPDADAAISGRKLSEASSATKDRRAEKKGTGQVVRC